jgi:4'-phosphopantetheinyl transferase
MLIERSPAPCLAVLAGSSAWLQRDPRDHVALLTPAERARAATMRQPGARDDFIVAHALVRHVAAALCGVGADRLTLVQRCAHCGGPHGAPRLSELPQLHVTISHAGGIVAVAASRSPVGIDLQRWDEGWRLAELAITPRLWLRRECLVKLGMAELDDPPPGELPTGWIETEQAVASMRVSVSVVSRFPATFALL